MGPIIINRHFRVSLSWRWKQGRRWTTQHATYLSLGYGSASNSEYPDYTLGDLIETATKQAMEHAVKNAATGFSTDDTCWGGWANASVEEASRVVETERWEQK